MADISRFDTVKVPVKDRSRVLATFVPRLFRPGLPTSRKFLGKFHVVKSGEIFGQMKR